MSIFNGSQINLTLEYLEYIMLNYIYFFKD